MIPFRELGAKKTHCAFRRVISAEWIVVLRPSPLERGNTVIGHAQVYILEPRIAIEPYQEIRIENDAHAL